MKKKSKKPKDKHLKAVLKSYKKRAKKGFEKYGKTLERNDLSILEWLQNNQEELMDATLYLERIKHDFKELKEAVDILEQHNLWRRGAETHPTDPKKLVIAIDKIVNILK